MWDPLCHFYNLNRDVTALVCFTGPRKEFFAKNVRILVIEKASERIVAHFYLLDYNDNVKVEVDD